TTNIFKGSIDHTIILNSSYRLDRTGCVPEKAGKIYRCHFIKGVVSNFVVVGKLRIQQRITLRNLQWVGSLDVRIQELKRWSLDPTVIGQLDHISVVQLPAYIQTWYQGTIGWNLSSLLAPEVSINMRIFISKSPFDGVIFQKAKSIGQVT